MSASAQIITISVIALVTSAVMLGVYLVRGEYATIGWVLAAAFAHVTIILSQLTIRDMRRGKRL